MSEDEDGDGRVADGAEGSDGDNVSEDEDGDGRVAVVPSEPVWQLLNDDDDDDDAKGSEPVSYTHLTLPTILRV